MVRGHVPFEVAGYVSLAVTLGLLCELPLYALVARLGARRGNARRAAAAIGALHLFAMGLGGPFFWGPSLHAYGRVLREAAGADSRDCGVVPLPQRRDGAVSCAQAALAEGAPFSVAFQVMGIDSTIYVGLAYRADGTPARIVWDSDVSGGYNLVPIRKIHKEDCSKPSIANADDSPRLSCGGDPGGA
jgi:hypothetical protein